MLRDVDIIIVGAGSAGAILAGSLSLRTGKRVLLIEAGARNKSITTLLPACFAYNFYNPRRNYCYYSEPEPELGGRRIYQPRGKGVGGSGAINAMIYVRGAKIDFDDWAAAATTRWALESVHPYFRRLECHYSPDIDMHGRDGQIGITSAKAGAPDICYDFFAACANLNIPFSHDFNNYDLDGYGFYDLNVRSGLRSSSSREYLVPALKHHNLRLLINARALRILFDKRRAVGVELWHNERRHKIYAADEIILSAGAIGSPQLLQLSGIGDSEHLTRLGIDCLVHNPCVGRGLQDHLCVSLDYGCSRKTANVTLRSLTGKLDATWKFLNRREGPLALGVKQSGAFVPITTGRRKSIAQIYFNPLSYKLSNERRGGFTLDDKPGVSFLYNIARPKSRGTVGLQSNNPLAAPLIHNRYLSLPDDRADMINAFRMVQNIASAAPLEKSLIDKNGYRTMTSDDAISRHINNSCGSIYHLCGSCAMGTSVENSVVSDRLEVHGVEGLRVVDASVFPNITSSNIQAPTFMLAEAAVDIICACGDSAT